MKEQIINRRYVITVSYGNFLSGYGGVDRFLLSHRVMFNARDISVIHIFPLAGDCRFITRGDIWGICIDDAFWGVKTTSGLLNWLSDLSKKGHGVLAYLIHNIDCADLNELRRIVESSDAPLFLYIHDFRTVCPLYGLAKDGKTYCDASFPDERKCASCSNYTIRLVERSNEIREFLNREKKRLTIIAPSEIARKIWSAAYTAFADCIIVVPHYRQQSSCTKIAYDAEKPDRLRLAFVGSQSFIKGWEDWKQAIHLLSQEQHRYEFYYFGYGGDKTENVKHVYVNFNNSLDDMTAELLRHRIDCAVLWTKIPETYSFTYYEATAANCYIITNHESGNIAEQTRLNQNGYVAEREESLYEVLKDEDRLTEAVERFRKSAKDLTVKIEENSEIEEKIASFTEYPVSSEAKITTADTFAPCLYKFGYRLYKRLATYFRNYG